MTYFRATCEVKKYLCLFFVQIYEAIMLSLLNLMAYHIFFALTNIFQMSFVSEFEHEHESSDLDFRYPFDKLELLKKTSMLNLFCQCHQKDIQKEAWICIALILAESSICHVPIQFYLLKL